MPAPPKRLSYVDPEDSDYVDDGDVDFDPVYSTPKKKKAPVTPSRSSKAKAKTPSPKKGKKAAPVQRDDKPFPLFNLPAETIDQILADPAFHLRDHLSLAASCRTLRAAYYVPLPRGMSPSSRRYTSDVWRVLCSNRPFVGKGWGGSPGKQARPSAEDERLLNHIFSREDKVEPGEVVVSHRTQEWEEAIDAVNRQRITKTTAQKEYKLNSSQLARVSYVNKRNPHSRAHPMQLYNEAAVESLALELHGGVFGHEELLRKRLASAVKRAETARKRKAGELESPSPSKRAKTADAVMLVATDDEEDGSDECEGEGEDGEEYKPFEREGTPTPVGTWGLGSSRG
ncbi:hypothetical protein JCM6882_002659 [Rhodosporidiobolus microsporus]